MKRSRGTVHRLLSLLSPLNKYGQQGNPETRSGASWIWKPSNQTKDLESIFFREYSLCCCLLDEESAAENWLGWVGRWVSGVDKWKSLFTRQVNFSNLQEGDERERERQKAENNSQRSDFSSPSRDLDVKKITWTIARRRRHLSSFLWNRIARAVRKTPEWAEEWLWRPHNFSHGIPPTIKLTLLPCKHLK